MKLSRSTLQLIALALTACAVGARAYALSCQGAGYVWTLEPVSVERLSGDADLAAEEARFRVPASLRGSTVQSVQSGLPEYVSLEFRESDPEAATQSFTFTRTETD